MIVRPWEQEDIDRVDLQTAQEYLRGLDLDMDMTDLSAKGLAFTGEVDGKVIGMAGVIPMWNGRAIAWALLAGDSGKHFPHIHKAIKRFLDDVPFNRVEATVDVGFKQGSRWVKMLGFELEGYMKAYRPNGGDSLLYAKVKS